METDVPPGFMALTFNPAQCRADLDLFERLLAENPDLSEREQILPFFRARPHLCLLLGTYNSGIVVADRLAYELSLFGQFTADVVVGDWRRKRYCLVEFEDGKRNSIFVRRGGRQTTDWTPRFLRGYSQVMDWFWLLDVLRDTEPFERQFGKRVANVAGLLVIGRDSGVSAADRLRLEWRRDHTIVNSQNVYCCTLDELARDLRERINAWPIVPPQK